MLWGRYKQKLGKIFTEKKIITLIDSTWESLNKTKFKKPFDLISMWDALEHAYDLSI